MTKGRKKPIPLFEICSRNNIVGELFDFFFEKILKCREIRFFSVLFYHTKTNKRGNKKKNGQLNFKMQMQYVPIEPIRPNNWLKFDRMGYYFQLELWFFTLVWKKRGERKRKKTKLRLPLVCVCQWKMGWQEITIYSASPGIEYFLPMAKMQIPGPKKPEVAETFILNDNATKC